MGLRTGVSRATSKIRNPQDFWGGLVLVVFTIFALWAASDLAGMRGFQFGPGTAPRLFAILLGGMGIVIMLIGLLTNGPRLQRYAVRGPILVTVAILFFAVAIRPFGLVLTSFVAVLLASSATDEVRWFESVVWAAFLSLFCSLLFPKALNLPLPLWPEWLTHSVAW
jgi:putative tricarboxylic transport membrane protein